MSQREAILQLLACIVTENSVWEVRITTVPATSEKPDENEFEN